jgi:hypothetical protein
MEAGRKQDLRIRRNCLNWDIILLFWIFLAPRINANHFPLPFMLENLKNEIFSIYSSKSAFFRNLNLRFRISQHVWSRDLLMLVDPAHTKDHILCDHSLSNMPAVLKIVIYRFWNNVFNPKRTAQIKYAAPIIFIPVI